VNLSKIRVTLKLPLGFRELEGDPDDIFVDDENEDDYIDDYWEEMYEDESDVFGNRKKRPRKL
jgi:hypothetical protein